MKKLLTIICLLAISTANIHANEFEFKPAKNQKIEGTFSADLNQEKSIHLILVKNKDLNNYQIIPFYMDENENTIQLETISTKNNSSVVSYHLNNSNLIFVLDNNEKKNKQYYIIDYDLKTKEQLIKKIDKKDNEFIFRLIDKTVIFKKVENSLETIEVISANNILNKKVDINSNDISKFNEIFEPKITPQLVNTNEFVKNGSVDNFQVFFENNHFIFSKINPDDYIVDTFTLNSNDYTYHLNSFKNENLTNIKGFNTYIHHGKLFSIAVNNDDALLKIESIQNGKILSLFSFSKDLKTHFESENLNEIIKQASKKRNKPTITINETIENKMAVNIDYVDIRVYSYDYNWWFHHWMWQQQQWGMQQMIQQNINNFKVPGGFGPNPQFYENSTLIKSEHESIRFILTDTYNIEENTSTETKYKDIDKDKYLDPLKDNSDLKHITASFQKDSFRYLYYSKKLDIFFIKTSKF